MKTQQQAETDEKQRIKSLVLNYDLSSETDIDGEYYNISLPRNLNRPHLYSNNIEQEQKQDQRFLQPARIRSTDNTNNNTLARHLHSLRQSSQSSQSNSISKKTAPSKTQKNTLAYSNFEQGIEKQPQNPYTAPRVDKAGNSARMQRGRKLQLSDMDWYEQQNSSKDPSDKDTAAIGGERMENMPFKPSSTDSQGQK
jgi:hypothetical protein